MRRTLALLAAAGVTALLLVAVGSTSSAVAAPGTWLSRINTYRAQNGLGPLAEDPVTSVVAQTWTETMAASNNLAHNPLLSQQVTTPWTRLGENVGYGGDEASLFQAFLGSPGHRANILGAYNAIGIGQAYANGQLWTTHVFLFTNAVLQPPPPPPPAPCSSAGGGVSPAGSTGTGQPTYVALTPARLMDTRPGGATTDGISAGGGALGPCATRTLTVTGRGGVPSSGVGAVVLNVTATGPTTAGYLTISPAGEARPFTSNLNFGPGQTIGNSVIAKVGANGQVAIYNPAGSTQVIVDISGWFPSTGAFSPITAARLLDTRPGAPTIDGISAGAGALAPGATRTLTVTGRGGVPATGVGAVVFNLTATGPTTAGYLTVHPTGTARQVTSNLNFGPGQTIGNLVIAKVGANGQVSIYNPSGSTHVIADVAGWFV
ncbi:MAG TPA: CAP domain-containing protein [Acidimicrobiales bacterium]|nr:CAP domain-containing protein [Acidimicrobiales bacterium]